MFFRKKHSLTEEQEEKNANIFLIVSTYIIPPLGIYLYRKNKGENQTVAVKYRNTFFYGVIVWFSLLWLLGPSGFRYCKDQYFKSHKGEYDKIVEKVIERRSELVFIDGNYYVSSDDKYDDLSCLDYAFKTENYSLSEKKDMINEVKFKYKQIRQTAEKIIPELENGEYLLMFSDGGLQTVYFAKEMETCVISSNTHLDTEPFKMKNEYSRFSELMSVLGCQKYDTEKLVESGNCKYMYEDVVKNYSKHN